MCVCVCVCVCGLVTRYCWNSWMKIQSLVCLLQDERRGPTGAVVPTGPLLLVPELCTRTGEDPLSLLFPFLFLCHCSLSLPYPLIHFSLSPSHYHSPWLGLSEEARADFRVMKDVAVYTRQKPHDRIQGMNRFLQQINT